MTRPKSNTPEGAAATQKWKQAMLDRYDGDEEAYKQHFKEMGAKGGRNGHTGGFSNNSTLAAMAGRKGGKKSRRTGVKNGQGKKHKEVVEDEQDN